MLGFTVIICNNIRFRFVGTNAGFSAGDLGETGKNLGPHFKIPLFFGKLANRALIKEPTNLDLSTKSEPWKEQELSDFRKTMPEIKAINTKRKEKTLRIKSKTQPA